MGAFHLLSVSYYMRGEARIDESNDSHPRLQVVMFYDKNVRGRQRREPIPGPNSHSY